MQLLRVTHRPHQHGREASRAEQVPLRVDDGADDRERGEHGEGHESERSETQVFCEPVPGQGNSCGRQFRSRGAEPDAAARSTSRSCSEVTCR